MQLNVDTGNFGGMVMEYFGMNYNLDARMRHEMTWTLYSGGLM